MRTRVLEIHGGLDCERLVRELPSLSGRDGPAFGPNGPRIVVTKETRRDAEPLFPEAEKHGAAPHGRWVRVGVWCRGGGHHLVSITCAPGTGGMTELGLWCAAVAELMRPAGHRERPEVGAPRWRTDPGVLDDGVPCADASDRAVYERELRERVPALELGDPAARRSTGPVRGERPGQRAGIVLEQGLAERVLETAVAADVLPEAVLSAAFDTTLRRWTGRPDFRVGLIAAAGAGGVRPAHPVVMRRQVPADAEPRTLIRESDDGLRRAWGRTVFGDTPLTDRWAVLGEVEGPLCEAAFTSDRFLLPTLLSSAPYVRDAALGEAGDAWTVHGLRVSVFPLPETAPLCDLQLLCRTLGDRPRVSLWWDPEVFAASSAETFASDYAQVLGVFCGTPLGRVRDIRLPARRNTLPIAVPVPAVGDRADFVEFPESALEYSIPDRFRVVAETCPGHTALDTANGTLTYAQLARLAGNTAAALIRACGPGPGHIALVLSDPLEMVPALLGTMMAGKSYLPLDPSYPRSRLELIIEDAAPQAVVVGSGHRGTVAELIPDVCPVLDAVTVSAQDTAAPRTAVPPDSCASLLYTSGSTGRPKGVLQSHRNVLFHIRNLTNLFRISPSDRHSVTASFSFDASTSDMYSALLNGACLVPIAVLRDGLGSLGRRLREQRVTLYHSTPTVFRHIAGSTGPAEAFPDLRLIVLGGEPVTQQDIRLFRRWFPAGCLLVNGYGATETSGFSAMHLMTADDTATTSVVPVGRPLPGLELLLRDEDGLDVRVSGELFVRSDHLGVGYWNNTAADAEAFGTEEHEGRTYRLYRTGDVARRTEDGTLRLLARKDRQVKIHGQRLELGEIESELTSLPGIAQAVVSVIHDPRSDSAELVAHVRPSSGATAVTGTEVRRALAGRLPAYMVPTYVSVVDSLPMTPTGKVDTNALEPPVLESFAEAVREEDLTPTEHIVLRVWCETLAVDSIGLDRNFFDVGGHSLLMARVHTRLESRLNRTFPLHLLFEHSTVRKAARFLDGERSALPDDQALTDRVALRVSRRHGRRTARRTGRSPYDSA
ncbi:amino acid adenylation domain-containing protein [Streptomyces sp. NPDC088554]|uniref:amino acid adenylation domain-containing protein n=1 Tax=Streptomyces sp. NPDC088554 TaxID=3365865 RepID=UPI00381502FD